MEKAYSIRACKQNLFVAAVIGNDISLDVESNRMLFFKQEAAEQVRAFCDDMMDECFQVIEETPMMVCVRVDGRVLVPVHAVDPKNHDAIIETANQIVSEMDFGELEDIDWKAIYIEGENGNRVYEY